MGTDKSKDGTGKGRKSSRYRIQRDAGDPNYKDLQPPSERPLPADAKCGALNQPGAQNKYCQQRKGSRTNHPGFGNCAKHGGSTEAGVKAAMREMGQHFALLYKQDFLKFGGDRRDPSIATLTPEQALLEEVRRSAAMCRYLEERIGRWNLEIDPLALEQVVNNRGRPPSARRADEASLEEDLQHALEQLPTEEVGNPGHLPRLTTEHPTTGIIGFTDAREWLILYREERGHLARVAKTAIDAGVAQRLVSIAEDQGRVLASAIKAVLGALMLSPEQAALVPRVVPAVLRAVASDSPVPSQHQLLALTQGSPTDAGRGESA